LAVEQHDKVGYHKTLSVASGINTNTENVENNMQFNNNTMNLTDAIKRNKNPQN